MDTTATKKENPIVELCNLLNSADTKLILARSRSSDVCMAITRKESMILSKPHKEAKRIREKLIKIEDQLSKLLNEAQNFGSCYSHLI